MIESGTSRIYWSTLEKAERYIRIKDNKLYVKYSKFEKNEAEIIRIIGVTLLLTTLLLMILIIADVKTNFLQKFLTMIFCAMPTAIIAIQMLNSTYGLRVAQRLEKWLKENQPQGI